MGPLSVRAPGDYRVSRAAACMQKVESLCANGGFPGKDPNKTIVRDALSTTGVAEMRFISLMPPSVRSVGQLDPAGRPYIPNNKSGCHS